jgi:hypothetical protein
MSVPDAPIPPRPAGLDRNSPAYREAVRAALADAPPVSPDVHACLRAVLARPAGNTAEPAAREASSGQFGGVGSDRGARAGGLAGGDQPVQVEPAIGSAGSVGGAPRELLEQGGDPVLAQRGPVASDCPAIRIASSTTSAAARPGP